METTDIAVNTAGNERDDILDPQIDAEGAERDLAAEFEELIRGEYKDVFAARVKGILVKRFRERTKDMPASTGNESEGRTTAEPDLEAEAGELMRDYPEFDLEKERADPSFMRLVAAGVDLRTAYEVTHRDTVFPAALRAALEEETRRLIQEHGSAAQRISEGSRTSAVARASYAADTRSAREALEKRAMKGEKIIL